MRSKRNRDAHDDEAGGEQPACNHDTYVKAPVEHLAAGCCNALSSTPLYNTNVSASWLVVRGQLAEEAEGTQVAGPEVGRGKGGPGGEVFLSGKQSGE